jgi:hypothetical protein
MGFLYIHILPIPNVKVMMSEDDEKNYFDTLGFAQAKIKPSTKSPNSPTGRAARAVLNEQQWRHEQHHRPWDSRSLAFACSLALILLPPLLHTASRQHTTGGTAGRSRLRVRSR